MKRLVKYLQPLISVCIGVFLFWLTFEKTDWNQVIQTLGDLDYSWVLLSMAFGYSAYIFRGVRWNLLIKPLGYSVKNITLIQAIAFSFFCNAAVPRSGEIMRCTSINKISGIPFATLFGHVLLERIIDFILLLTCISIAILCNYHEFTQFTINFSGAFFEKIGFVQLPWLSVIALIVFILVVLIYMFRKRLFSEKNILKIRNFFWGIKQGFLSIKDIQNKPLFLIYTLGIWLCYLLMTFVCFSAFSGTNVAKFTLNEGVFMLAAGGIGMVIPSPGGLGSYHLSATNAMQSLRAEETYAELYALVVHASETIMIISAGLIAMIILYTQIQKRYNG